MKLNRKKNTKIFSLKIEKKAKQVIKIGSQMEGKKREKSRRLKNEERVKA